MATLLEEELDYGCSSSITPLDSSHNWLSNLSFGGHSSNSLRFLSENYLPYYGHKPHKANQSAWEAINHIQREHGQVGLNHFQILCRLGSGDIGTVYLCQIQSPVVGFPQCFYAMKVVDREAIALKHKLKGADIEKEVLSMLDHPFLPTLYANFDASHYLCLVMEYCPGGNLLTVRQHQPGQRFSVPSSKFYAAEVLLALEYLHMIGVVHRDLKPENVLIREDGHIMLSDFDLSLKCDVDPKLFRCKPEPKAIDNNIKCFYCFPVNNSRVQVNVSGIDLELLAEPINAQSKSFVGTHEYLAPEVLSGFGHGSAVDWWAFGVCLYELLFGRTPFKGENNEKTLRNILKQPLTFPSTSLSNGKDCEEMGKAQDLISKLLVKNPKKRLGSLRGSSEIKKHIFFKDVNWALIRSNKPPVIPTNPHNKRTEGSSPKLSENMTDGIYNAPHDFDYF